MLRSGDAPWLELLEASAAGSTALSLRLSQRERELYAARRRSQGPPHHSGSFACLCVTVRTPMPDPICASTSGTFQPE